MCPWALYQAYGDTAVLRDSYASMVRFVDWSIARCVYIRPSLSCMTIAAKMGT